MYSRILHALTVAVVVLSPVTASAQGADPATIPDLEAQIAALQQQLQQLQTQLAALQAGAPLCHTFSVNLALGARGTEVAALHDVLQREGLTIPSAEPDNAGSLFGEVTAYAVVTFQERYRAEVLSPKGLVNGTGYVGPATRAKLNSLYGCDLSRDHASTSSDSARHGSLFYFALDPTSTVTLNMSVEGGRVKNYSSSVVGGAPGTNTPVVTVAPRETFTLTWRSAGTKTCTATGDWSGFRPPSGSEQITAANWPRRYSYALACYPAALTAPAEIAQRITWNAALPYVESGVRLVVEGTPRPLYVSLLSPTAGTVVEAGAIVKIQWVASESIRNVYIVARRTDRGYWSYIVPATANTGSYDWVVPTVEAYRQVGGGFDIPSPYAAPKELAQKMSPESAYEVRRGLPASLPPGEYVIEIGNWVEGYAPLFKSEVYLAKGESGPIGIGLSPSGTR